MFLFLYTTNFNSNQTLSLYKSYIQILCLSSFRIWDPRPMSKQLQNNSQPMDVISTHRDQLSVTLSSTATVSVDRSSLVCCSKMIFKRRNHGLWRPDTMGLSEVNSSFVDYFTEMQFSFSFAFVFTEQGGTGISEKIISTCRDNEILITIRLIRH